MDGRPTDELSYTYIQCFMYGDELYIETTNLRKFGLNNQFCESGETVKINAQFSAFKHIVFHFWF